MTRPQLSLVNTDTGELVEDDRDVLIEQLKGELTGKSLQIGKLKKELRELRAVEPEAEAIREVLTYWQERCMPTAVIAPGGKRWEKARARLREKLDGRNPWTPAELKLAIDGAVLDPWMNGTAPKSTGFLDPVTIFRDSEKVEQLINLALGFKSKAGVELGDLLEFAPELSYVPWKDHLRVCICGCRRISHSRGDPNLEGRQGCLSPGCECEDWDEDFNDPFNIKHDAWLQREWAS